MTNNTLTQGFLLIHKPEGLTSHDVIDCVRRITGVKTVGHAGTLDPFAIGLLLVGVGREATREMSRLVGLDKTYEATFVLGASSNTDDRTGVLIAKPIPLSVTEKSIVHALQTFVGTIEQMPPQFSAVKIQGKKMYESARAGITINAKPRTVTMSKIEILHIRIGAETIEVHLVISCSSGTYIRALARDLGAKLGTGGYVKELCRTAIGPFQLSETSTIDELKKNNAWTKHIIPLSDFFQRLFIN